MPSEPYVDKGRRKLGVSLTAMGLVTLGFIVCSHWPSLIPVYPHYTVAVLGAATIFSGANVAEKMKRPPQ